MAKKPLESTKIIKIANYKKAGVDVNKSDKFVSWVKKQVPYFKKNVFNDFASLVPIFDLKYKNPVLAASTDGVGTKSKLAVHFNEFSTIGQDLVAMCVNDLICTGAKPLFFLDYYSCSKLNTRQIKSFIKGLEKACSYANCSLVGGETAEMPNVYQGDEFDCAGFAVGIVEKEKVLGSHLVKNGDKILGLSSSGFHSNGYSLLRQIYKTPKDLLKHKKLLMEPSRIYSSLAEHIPNIKGLKSLAHITGGGMNNISRAVPPKLKAQLKPWFVPSYFLNIKKQMNITWTELFSIFNCGIGLVAIVSDPDEFLLVTQKLKMDVIDLGEIVPGSTKVSKRWSVSLKEMDKKNKIYS